MSIQLGANPIRVTISGSAPGPAGGPGVGISGLSLNGVGELVATLSDGTTLPPVTLPQFGVESLTFNGTELVLLPTEGAELPPLNMTGLVLDMAATGHYFADQGAHVLRAGDRALFGAAADNPAMSNRLASPTDWLSTVMEQTPIGPWASAGATAASLSRIGSIGLLGAARTSDAVASAAMLGFIPASIGVASWGINDALVTPTTATGWAFYGEGWRLAGVDYQPTFVAELEAVNLGGAITGQGTPYQVNVGGGVYGLQIGSGGGQETGAANADAAMTVVANPTAFATGVLFGATALAGTNGADAGFATAMALAANHALVWHTPEVVGGQAGPSVGGFFRITTKLAANATRLELTDIGLLYSNGSGKPILAIPQSGELQLTAPVAAAGSSAAAVPALGWLHVNINGVEGRVPIFSPAQAGG